MSNSRAGTSAVNVSPLGNQPSTSITTSTSPANANTDTDPSAPNGTITMLATVCPGTMFRFDAVGRGPSPGHTVRNDAADGFVTVTFNATAPAPLRGTPPRPAIGTTAVLPPRTGMVASPRPSTVGRPGRVSYRRAGDSAVNDECSSGNQPITSTTRSVAPAKLNTETVPSAPTLAITMFDTTLPAVAFRFDAVGRAEPVGHTVTYVSAVGCTAVTFNATAPTPDDGTPPRPTTRNVVVDAAPTWPAPLSSPSMVA